MRSSLSRPTLALILAVLGFSSPAGARLATAGDLASVNEHERADILVDKNGHSKVIIDRLIRINNDDGRERESTQFIDFNDRSSHLKILKAETINSGHAIQVSKKNIEIKAVSDFSRYFDVQKKAKITFPDVQNGSRVHLRYELDVHEVPNEGFWSFLADFNWWFMEHYDAHIRSALPLWTWKNDPDGIIEMKPGRKGKFYTLDIHTRAPIDLQTAQEENAYIRSERSLTFVVTTLDSWEKYARPTIARQEKLLALKLPPSMERIRAEAAKETTAIAKLDRVAALISQEYRYFGDWRRRDGGFVPRPLNEISETRYGDCKDLSLTAVAIYRALGLKADLAWTLRGDPQYKPTAGWFKYPVDWFNHAVARVEADGKVYWIDATNPVSYASSIPADISGKPAFILNAEKSYLEFIPDLTSSSFQSEKSLVYHYQPDRTLKVTGELKMKGRAAINMTTNAFYKPLDTVNYELAHALSYGYKMLDYSVGEYPRGSRIVSDMSIPFAFTLADIGVRTSAGYGFLLSREAAIDRVLEEIHDRASDVYLDTPGVWLTREEVVGVKRVGSENLDCDLSSPWMNAKREVTETSDGVVASDRTEIIKGVITNEELQTPEFEKFQADLRECFFKAAIIVDPR